MLLRPVFRAEEQEDGVDRLLVEGVEVDALLGDADGRPDDVDGAVLTWGTATPRPKPVEPLRSRSSSFSMSPGAASSSVAPDVTRAATSSRIASSRSLAWSCGTMALV